MALEKYLLLGSCVIIKNLVFQITKTTAYTSPHHTTFIFACSEPKSLTFAHSEKYFTLQKYSSMNYFQFFNCEYLSIHWARKQDRFAL